MKASQLFFPTLREIPVEAEVASHQLLLRAGYIRKTGTGVYTYLPLGLRVIHKISQIVRVEMNAAEGQEIMMPIIQPRALWETTGRWNVYGEEMFKLKDRHGRYFALGPTHEELITSLIHDEIHSYRNLPLRLYQIQNKYRDEIRPRFGLMRSCEFIMKDLYSFDLDKTGLNASYTAMYDAYKNIYQKLQLDYRVVEADSGAIGGNNSHEFMVLANSGESLILYCDHCDYAANQEKADRTYTEVQNNDTSMLPLEEVYTPNRKTIEEIADFLQVSAAQTIKTMIYVADNELIAVLLRGDRFINEVKLKNVLGCNDLFLAPETMIAEKLGTNLGFLGPVGLKLKFIADREIESMKNFICGANKNNFHLLNVNWKRDVQLASFYDISNVVAGDMCPLCSQPLQETRGIEVGHIFQLGTKYSKALDAHYIDAAGAEHEILMGCYGIGISRTMAATVEQKHDDNGIIWPIPIAPYHVIIIPVNSKKTDQNVAALAIYQQLLATGVEVILDDRDERAGVKFKDADLIGIPIKITVGPKSLANHQVEMKLRWETESQLLDIDEVVDKIKHTITANLY